MPSTQFAVAVATDLKLAQQNLWEAFLLGQIPASALGEPDWGPNGKVVYDRTYSRPLFTSDGERQRWTMGDTEGRTHEVWAETCRRVVLGNTGLSVETLQKNEAIRLFNAMFTFAIVPAGRHLWVDGTGSPFTRNCWSAPMGERTSGHFKFLGSRLFEGGGVGANYSNDMLADSTPVGSKVNVYITAGEDHVDIEAIKAAAGESWATRDKVTALMRHGATTTRYVNVPDSREGWVEQWTSLVDTACSNDNDTIFIFNVGGVRPFGAELKTYGGTASGPAPLVTSLTVFERVLNGAFGRRLNSMEVMDLDHEIAASVVAGGTRRSARLACKSWADDDIADFIFCKSDPSKHWSTNISVEIDDDFERAVHNADDPMHIHATKVLRLVAEGMAKNGEPGFINSSRLSEGENTRIRTTNPCVTADTWVHTTDGIRQVGDLMGKKFTATGLPGGTFDSTDEGFFLTGHKPIIGLNIDGTVLKLTHNHEVMTPDGWVEAGQLRVGDVVSLGEGAQSSTQDVAEQAAGYLLGLLVGDGTFGNDRAILDDWGGASNVSVRDAVVSAIETLELQHRSDWSGWHEQFQPDKFRLQSKALTDLAASYGIVPGNKTITKKVMEAHEDFRRGFLRGLFDADGHIEGESTGSGIHVILSQSDSELLSNARIMLLDLGIRGVVRGAREAGYRNMPGGRYWCKKQERLIISGKSAADFAEAVGFANTVKAEKLASRLGSMSRGPYAKPMIGRIIAITDEGTEDVYDAQVPGANAFVANGTIVHNCGEIALETEGSEFGEACNIGSVNLDRVGTNTAFGVEMFELLSRFLYRATLMPYPGKDANHIEDRNRRIGAGFMGLQEWVLHHGVRLTEAPYNADLTAKLRLFRDTVRRSADWLADDLGTPRSIKVTTVAPNGSISKLPGAAPGIHPVLARYAEQRIRFGTADPKLADMQAKGYPIEPCVYAANTMVVTIPTRDFIMNKGFNEDLIEQADEVSLDAFLTIQKWVSQTYVGGRDGNAVSATASIPEGMDIEDVTDILKRHIFELKGTTVFPSASRPQQPVTAITKAEYEELVEFCEAMSASFVDDCSTGACPVR